MESDTSEDYYVSKKKVRISPETSHLLSTINRYNLDFDFEKVCSVTLTNSNVYSCLVCGKYFQGRGKSTSAYVHSIDSDHQVFINLSDGRVWCLPEDFESVDPSLYDIKFNLDPRYSDEDVKELPSSSLSLNGSEFFPGLMGLNQIKEDSYLNACIHALCGVGSLRDYFLTNQFEGKLAKSFSELLRKVNNARNFKGIVSPHEFLQAVAVASKNEFFASSADPCKFLNWFLPALQAELPLGAIQTFFKGSTINGSFMTISIDIPMLPVFKKESELIPSVALEDILYSRFASDPIKKYPETLVLCFKRFVLNNFFLEKNSTIVRFPLTNLDMSPYGASSQRKDDNLYSLVSTICHEGKPEDGHFKAFVLHPVSKQWFECDALRIRKQLPESVSLVESYVQIWTRNNPNS